MLLKARHVEVLIPEGHGQLVTLKNEGRRPQRKFLTRYSTICASTVCGPSKALDSGLLWLSLEEHKRLSIDSDSQQRCFHVKLELQNNSSLNNSIWTDAPQLQCVNIIVAGIWTHHAILAANFWSVMKCFLIVQISYDSCDRQELKTLCFSGTVRVSL
jgi:hypothetical protein